MLTSIQALKKKIMLNFTDDELEVGRIAYRQGLKWGQDLKNLIDDGVVDPTKPINLILPVGTIKIENFSKKTRFLIELGSARTGVIGNSLIVSTGFYTGGSSLMGYAGAKNSLSKTFYGLSVVCSSSAIASAGLSLVACSCQISQTGALSEAFGTAFMVLGNQARVQALQLEGKPTPPHLNSYVHKSLRQPLYGANANGLAFIMPRRGNFIILGKFVGIGLSMYGYSKLIVAIYRYGQQLFKKYKNKKDILLLRKQIRFVIVRLALLVDPSIYYKLAT